MVSDPEGLTPYAGESHWERALAVRVARGRTVWRQRERLASW
jgi:hypothetical protein